jgi:tetratricopeptide (TPR) repeat protein
MAQELSYGSRAEGEFPSLFAALLNAADANPKRENPDRQRYQQRIPVDAKPPADPVALADRAAVFLRLGQPDAALNLLAPRQRALDFRGLANLAQAFAQRGEWSDARRIHDSARLDVDFPDDLAGTTAEQRRWLKSVEYTHYRRWLDQHTRRAAAKGNPAEEDVFPLFDGTPPPDAIPIVQQLLLWAPWDGQLVWLLATLYADAGRLREADILFQQCVEGRQMSNRQRLMARRAQVREAVALLPRETVPDEIPLTPAEPDPANFLPSRERVVAMAVAFGGIVLLAVTLQLRAMIRRRNR